MDIADIQRRQDLVTNEFNAIKTDRDTKQAELESAVETAETKLKNLQGKWQLLEELKAEALSSPTEPEITVVEEKSNARKK